VLGGSEAQAAAVERWWRANEKAIRAKVNEPEEKE
jgi:hypothetical protein